MILKTDLYDHQRKAVNKLQKIKVSALFMEQGTGKTRTVLELIKIKYNLKKINHVIWLCPCSVKNNLKTDIIYHVGEFPSYFTICGIETISSSYKAVEKLNDIAEHNKCYIVIDESILIKNPYAIRTHRITMLAQKCQYRSILNGTPISRDESDLFCQFYILDWRILGYKSYWSFAANHLEYDEKYRRVTRILNKDYLARKIAPYTYQVSKEECLKCLNPKEYIYSYYQMDEALEYHYVEITDMFLEDVDEFDSSTIYRLFTALQLVISGRRIVSKLHQRIKTVPFYKNDIDNPRIAFLIDTIDKYDDDEKIIIYCKFQHEIDSIVPILIAKYGSECCIDFSGKISIKKRVENIESFRNNARFMVANKRCAGYGLNLQFCHNIIYYNNDWDLATRLQSEDRVHRIGQTEQVYIRNIIAENKLDERIVKCLDKKESLAENFKREIKSNNDLKEWLEVKNDKNRTKCNRKEQSCADLRER